LSRILQKRSSRRILIERERDREREREPKM